MKPILLFLSLLIFSLNSFSQPSSSESNFKKSSKLKKGIMLGIGSNKYQRVLLPRDNPFNIEANQINDFLKPGLKIYLEGFLEKDFTEKLGWQANIRVQSTQIVLENMPFGEEQIANGSQTTLNFMINPAIHFSIFKNDERKIYLLGGVTLNSPLRAFGIFEITNLEGEEMFTNSGLGFEYARFEYGIFSGIGLNSGRLKLELRAGQYNGFIFNRIFRNSHLYIELSAGAFLGK